MRKLLTLLLIMLSLSGCTAKNHELEQMMTFRASLLSAMGCQFSANITADYHDELYQFTLDCQCDEEGNLYFEVQTPESISGINGSIRGSGGKIYFENETALAFETMADGQITPITAAWVFVKALRSGYVTSCGIEDDDTRVSIEDSYQENGLRLDIWFTPENNPKHAEILWKDRRILSLDVVDFEIL